MRDSLAISLTDVTKTYRLYSSVKEQALDVLGVTWLRFWRGPRYTTYPALDGISLEVERGERVGIVGRNGAGKTTLLKLITGNFAPTSGAVHVNGTVQALMQTGLGFHPEFTGHDNVRSALLYNGLSRNEIEAAIEDVINFAELGEFIDQPLKTYSLGMQSRLMFAAATAIRPDIIIIDEVLGAGDAYFSAKSAQRMQKLAASGCTLLLVSHSMQQVLQFCKRAIWIESGRIVKEGPALAVVKGYEEFTQKLERESAARNTTKSILHDKDFREALLKRVLKANVEDIDARIGPNTSPGGASRWGGGEPGLRIDTLRITDDEGSELQVAKTRQPLIFEIGVVAEEDGRYPCYFVILLFTEDGRCVTRHCSEAHDLIMKAGERYLMHLRYPETLLGNGTYSFSAAIYKSLDLTRLESARFYDLLSRSFEFRVVDNLRDDQSVFHHPASWIPMGPGSDA
jgi:homopolymeric O-antigen transport system ATP-binding protein